MIREMALQQKKKKEEESSGSCHLSWNCKTATSTTGGIWTFTNILKYCMHKKHAGHTMVKLYRGHIFIDWSSPGCVWQYSYPYIFLFKGKTVILSVDPCVYCLPEAFYLLRVLSICFWMLAFEMMILMFKLFVMSQVVKWCLNKCKWESVCRTLDRLAFLLPVLLFTSGYFVTAVAWYGGGFSKCKCKNTQVSQTGQSREACEQRKASSPKYTLMHFWLHLCSPCLPANSWGYFVTALMEREEIEGNFCYSCARAHLALVRFPDPLVSRWTWLILHLSVLCW